MGRGDGASRMLGSNKFWRKPHAGKGSAGGRGEGWHQKHFVHACDAGRVEAQRLVEGRQLLAPLRSGVGMRAGRGERAVGGAGGHGASRMQGRARL